MKRFPERVPIRQSKPKQATRSVVIARALVQELRERLVVLPSIAVIERIAAEAATRAQRKVFTLLTEDLTSEQRIQLDGLLELRNGGTPFVVRDRTDGAADRFDQQETQQSIARFL